MGMWAILRVTETCAFVGGLSLWRAMNCPRGLFLVGGG